MTAVTITFRQYAEWVAEDTNDTAELAGELAECRLEGPRLAFFSPAILKAIGDDIDPEARVKMTNGRWPVVNGVEIRLSGFGPRVCGRGPMTVAQKKAVQRKAMEKPAAPRQADETPGDGEPVETVYV